MVRVHWIETCESLRNLSKVELHKQHVCRKYFKILMRFLASTRLRSRLRDEAFPTLFTESEIAGTSQTAQTHTGKIYT